MAREAESGTFQVGVQFDTLTPAVLHRPAGPCVACGRTVSTGRCTQCGTTRDAGRYRTVKVIGQRPFSRTYLAFDPKYDQHVVVKELWFAQLPSVTELESFGREAALLSSVDHRRVPRLLKAFRLGDGPHLRLYLVREYVRGTSLATLARQKPLDEPEARHVARQVLRVLRNLHAHRPPIVHRDLRPHHLLRRPSGNIHLLGFGAARWVEEGGTFDATLVGQPGYASFEQLGGTLDPGADLHGLGATLLHLITGTDPFALMPDGRHLIVPRDLRVSPAFSSFLQRLLAPAYERFASAHEAYEALTVQHRLADALEWAAAWLRR